MQLVFLGGGLHWQKHQEMAVDGDQIRRNHPKVSFKRERGIVFNGTCLVILASTNDS